MDGMSRDMDGMSRDMDGMSLVKGLPHGMQSHRWPGERYDAKAAFDVVAAHYGSA